MRVHGFTGDVRIKASAATADRPVVLQLGGLRLSCTTAEARDLADALHDLADTLDQQGAHQ
ncbi:hypothetical protein R4227_16415 [Gordonia amicalis]|uniref:hypothetical protein n=1 Tax=Gordonia amicalis TaxID=89053 RepID=UPI00295356D6|nr:hypothetical protein [Gordonia amicalis]MDV7101656.1 hypothetical protein [Gordonia amicalis]